MAKKKKVVETQCTASASLQIKKEDSYKMVLSPFFTAFYKLVDSYKIQSNEQSNKLQPIDS